MSVNQAVVFTKPVHHLRHDVSPEQLAERTRGFFEDQGFSIALARHITGADLEARAVLRKHYLLYSAAVYAEPPAPSAAGRALFAETFGKTWDAEAAAGRILSTRALLATRKIDPRGLFTHWNTLFSEKATKKIQDGMVVGFSRELDAWLVNAFYPELEALFYHPDNEMYYFVMDFDSARTSWRAFRGELLGATNARAAAPGSLRARLYSEFPVAHPGRDNFVHGSAGPFEGLVERAVHEPELDLRTNPAGRFLAERGMTRASFEEWKSRRSIAELATLFRATEELDTPEALAVLAPVLNGE